MKKRRSKKKKLNIIAIILVLLFAVLISFGISIYCDYNGSLGSAKLIGVNIPTGSSVKDIAGILKQHKIINHPIIFRLAVKNASYEQRLKMGEHALSSGMSYAQIMAALEQNVSYVNGVKILIPEGFELRQIVDELENKGLIDRHLFLAALERDYDYPFLKDIPRRANRLEGYLFPATYEFPLGISEQDIIIEMLNKFNSEFDQSCYNKAAAMGMTTDEVITLASIIEREAASDDDRAIVSSVFHNRLKSESMPFLESCATVQYILKERKPVLSIADTKIDSPYNTYRYEGLPPGPIASPGKASIMAALEPAQTGYYYFVVGENGKHVFSKTLQEHNNATPR